MTNAMRLLIRFDEAEQSELKYDHPDAFIFGMIIRDTDDSMPKVPGAIGTNRSYIGGLTWDDTRDKIDSEELENFLVMGLCETKAEAHELADEFGGEKV